MKFEIKLVVNVIIFFSVLTTRWTRPISPTHWALDWGT